jgi:hypothetical protein
MVVAGGRSEAFDEKLVVRSFDESGLLVETAQDDMLRLFWNVESCKPCHAGFSVGRALVGFGVFRRSVKATFWATLKFFVQVL